MSKTVLDSLVTALDQAAVSDGNVFTPPEAILWPDKARQWEGAIRNLRRQRRIVTLGSRDSETATGPAYWLRCVVAETVAVDGPEGLPIIYLPGVSRDDLRGVVENDQVLAPLAPLNYRSQWFTQPNGKDWTVRALLVNKDRGLGLNVASDEKTAQALADGVDHILQQPLSRLKDRYIDAAFLNGLLNPDPVRLVLRWIDDPKVLERELSAVAWDAFVSQCKSDFSFNPMSDGVIEAASRLGVAEGVWDQVWQRFRESPADYPNIPSRLRDAKPLELFTPSSMAWPQDNEAAEDQLRAQLLDFEVLTPSGARDEIRKLEASHRERRGSVWSQLGKSPLALALEHLVKLALSCDSTPAGTTVQQLRQNYASVGWQADLAALRALGEVDEERDTKAVASVLKAIYQPWLEYGAIALQNAVGPEANSGTYKSGGAPTPSAGEVVMFVDGLRLDIAHVLAERLQGAQAIVTIDVVLAALPTVTQTSKPAIVPIDQTQLGPGDGLDACRVSNGATAGVQVLRSFLSEANIQVLNANDFGHPSGRAWTETGEIDHRGHSLGARLASEIEEEVTKIARRCRDLLSEGWTKITIVTDHGWLLLPSGLPKNESLPAAATVIKKGRCARLKEGSSVAIPTVPWYWDKDIRIAIAQGISCFEINQQYEHGGVSPQECFVPLLTVTSSTAKPNTPAEITSMKWRGLTLVVEFAELPEGAKVDLRRHAGDARSSIADLARLTSGTGKIILLVEDEDLEGERANLVVVDGDNTILLQRETHVGQNR